MLRWRFLASVKRKRGPQTVQFSGMYLITLGPFGVCETCNEEKGITLALFSVCET